MYTPILIALLTVLSLGPATSQRVNNLARSATTIFATSGEAGITTVSLAGAVTGTIPVPAPLTGIHDAAVDGDLLFVLDANVGFIALFNATTLSAIPDTTRGVAVGPFSGVAASAGVAIVSGGTGPMSIFRYTSADLTLLSDDIDLGIGQPDVLLNPQATHAYVSTDFRGAVDGVGFGITTLDVARRTPTATLGLNGAGFTPGGQVPANFPLECAIAGDRLLVAHGGGLSILSLADPSAPELLTTIMLDFPAVNVDAVGDTAVVVGGSTPSAARVDLRTNQVENLALLQVPGATAATGVLIAGDRVIIAAGDLIVCDGECFMTSGDGGDTPPEQTDDPDSDGDDSDICVEEEYLLRRVPRSALLHSGEMATVLCPGYGLPCGTPSHVVRFDGSYLTYRELCAKVACSVDRKIVNGVSLRHSRLLCAAHDEHCVVPHVMRTKFELERVLIRAVHSRMVG